MVTVKTNLFTAAKIAQELGVSDTKGKKSSKN